MTTRPNLTAALLLPLLAYAFGVGCEKEPWPGKSAAPSDAPSSESKDSTTANAFVGTWKLTSKSEGVTWYAIFNNDKTWKICDNADGSEQRVFGTYTVSGSKLIGDMTNPGVGKGEINATVSGNAMTLNFIEHWHDPYKTVVYTGSKL